MTRYKEAPFGSATDGDAWHTAESAAERIDDETIVMENSNNDVVVVMAEDADDEGFGTFEMRNGDDVKKANRAFAEESTDDKEASRYLVVAHGASGVIVGDDVGGVCIDQEGSRSLYAPEGTMDATTIQSTYATSIASEDDVEIVESAEE